MTTAPCPRCGSTSQLYSAPALCAQCGDEIQGTAIPMLAAEEYVRLQVRRALDRWCSMNVATRDLCAEEIISIVRGEKT